MIVKLLRAGRSVRLGRGAPPVLLAALLLASCAVMEPPPGGPVDDIRPHLVATSPDSGVTGLLAVDKLEFTFSEKMNRVPAVGWLSLYPGQGIRKTSWHGATRAEVRLEQTLPPDTVIVVEVAGGMKDAHKVANRRSRRFPIATGAEIPAGRITGALVMGDSAVSNGVVELYAIPPDTLEYFEQDMLRRTVTDNTGAYIFDWLPVPGGPWLLRAFADDSGDLRPGEKEAKRLVPDTLSLSTAAATVSVGATTLYPVKTPGRLLIDPFTPPDFVGGLMAWTMAITEQDTGWVPAPEAKATYQAVRPDTISSLEEVPPGATRLVVFVDVDGDSLFSAVADSLLPAAAVATATADSDTAASHYLEPWLMVEGLTVPPGLAGRSVLPADPFTLTPWQAVSEPDSGGAPADSSAALTDSTMAAPTVDPGAGVRPDSTATEDDSDD